MYSLDTVFRDIKSIINTVVIKYDNKAKENETLETKKAYDLYKLALVSNDRFEMYDSFDARSIQAAGILNQALIDEYVNDKFKIPIELREVVLYYQRQITVAEYEEKNNYYRMLIGLPDTDDKDFIFIDIGVGEELEIDYTIPLHKLTNDEILRLEIAGEIDKIKSKYNKSYLDFLGINRIPIELARDSMGFSILRMTKDVTDSFYEEFNRIYGQCREYYMSVIYIKEFGKRYEMYDNFIGMMIMIMTIQRMFVNTFKYGIDRDFYDLGSIKLLFDSYNVPFIEELPMNYQRILMKNLNTLLRYKSSDKVLYDLCNILGFDNTQIYKYFLSKEHIKDDNGNPIFVYKDVIDDVSGETSQELDKEKMFSIKWKSVDLKERNVPSALLDTKNVEDYRTVISNDPFWLEDDNLKHRLYESEFNYIESKYLKMSIMYNMTAIMFETIYLFRMISDKKESTLNIKLKLPRLFDDNEIPLFTIVMFLSALICKRNKLKGNIITTPAKTLSILGFNFDIDFNAIRQFIIDNSKYVDQTMLMYINAKDLTTSEGVNSLFTETEILYHYLIDAMRYSKSKKEYDVHKKLFDTLMITNYSDEIYKKSDGEVAETYLDLVRDLNPNMYTFIMSSDDTDISDAVEHVILQISNNIIELQNQQYLNADNNVVMNALIKLIDFFKSYTTDLTSFNVLYLFGSDTMNIIRMINEIDSIDKYTHPVKDTHTIVAKMNLIIRNYSQKDSQIMWDKLKYLVNSYPEDFIEYYEKYEFNKLLDMEEDSIYNPFNDILYNIESQFKENDYNLMRDTLKIIYET